MIHKTFYSKIYILLVLLMCSLAAKAQDPGTDLEDENGDTSGSLEEAPAPIDSNIIWLVVAGVAFGFYYFKKQPAQVRGHK